MYDVTGVALSKSINVLSLSYIQLYWPFLNSSLIRLRLLSCEGLIEVM